MGVAFLKNDEMKLQGTSQVWFGTALRDMFLATWKQTV
jgi:hypothetical protein